MPRMREALREALTPFAVEGLITEVVETQAVVFGS